MHAKRIMAVNEDSAESPSQFAPSKCRTSLKINETQRAKNNDSSSGEFVSLVFHRNYLSHAQTIYKHLKQQRDLKKLER